MTDGISRDPARDPQDLEPFFVSRQRAGDVDGMMALYEPDAVVDPGDGRLLRGKEAIRVFFEEVVASGRKYNRGEQRYRAQQPGRRHTRSGHDDKLAVPIELVERVKDPGK